MPESISILGDCMDYMRGLPDKAVDLLIADPPYGIGDTWSKNRNDRFYIKGKQGRYQNEEAPSAAYFQECFRVSRNQIFWGGNYFTDHLTPTNSWIVWKKHRIGAKVKMSEAELAWTSYRKVMMVADLNWSGAVKCEPGNKIHPHQKPVKLYRFCYEYAKNEFRTILDTHLGSGSSRIAALEMGFDFTGIELDPVYFESQEKRFKQHTSQQKIFV